MQYKKCCFTGVQAYNLPWKDNEKDERCLMLKAKLRVEIINLIEQGFNYFISGMETGIETYCAETVLDLKISFPSLKLECAIPCKEQSKSCDKKDVERYNNILERADKTTYLFKLYNQFCNQVRNKYMVNSSDYVLAVWNGAKSGRAYTTIKYAQRHLKQIKIIKL